MEDGAIESENIVRSIKVDVSRAREEVDGENRELEKRQKLQNEPSKQQNGSGGGLLDNLLSKLSSPRENNNNNNNNPVIDLDEFEEANGHHKEAKEGGECVDNRVENGEGGGGVGCGGVINNLISFFHKNDEGEDDVRVVNGGGGGGEERKEIGGVEESEVGLDKRSVDQEIKSGKAVTNGGSIISNLAPDDVAPASDEASILIHSVVHD